MTVSSLGLRSVANSLSALSSPVEVLLRKKRLDLTAVVRHEDEATEPLRIKSVSMRGAQREVTTLLKKLGYRPVTGWKSPETTGQDSGWVDSHRVFRISDE